MVDNKMRDYYEEQLTKLHTQMIAMGSLCEKAIADATRSLTDGDIELAKEVMNGDAKINQQERDIEAMCIKLLLHQQPVAGGLRGDRERRRRGRRMPGKPSEPRKN